MDTSVIPLGRYCYHVVKIKNGEVLRRDVEAFGRNLREYHYHGSYKEKLCPYWQRTEYGTVRCNFLDREFVDEEDDRALEKIAAHSASPEASGRFERSWALSDEIKICGLHEDEDTEWVD
ncbi:MAG: hypothetical protein HZB87_07210 [Desulfatitalea sp.]|nr:hypothetical protein [Desulfatitalea sp.]